ncbi:MAG: hypothetical protein JO322_06760 [Candidatus Eremiobacteraeota bacterium]|nr:hypothetical protein [Candidatus Eremiobacteraeota bacterium]
MDNYVAIVVADRDKAFDALHRLWALNEGEESFVRGAAVVQRDADGKIALVSKDTDAGARTIVGTAAGLLIGAIAAAAAMTVTPIAIGTAVGLAAGATADAVKSGEHQQAASETQYILPDNASAIVAEIEENSDEAVDRIAAEAGGKVYRREKSTVLTDRWFGDDSNLYLYPYDYEPGVPPPA